MAFQITGVWIVCSAVCSGANKKKSKLRVVGLCEGDWIHWWPVDFPAKGSATRKMFPFDDVIKYDTCESLHCCVQHRVMLCYVVTVSTVLRRNHVVLMEWMHYNTSYVRWVFLQISYPWTGVYLLNTQRNNPSTTAASQIMDDEFWYIISFEHIYIYVCVCVSFTINFQYFAVI